MVFQSYALYPHMLVKDNLAFGLRRRRTPGQIIREKVGRVAGALGLRELMDRRPGMLSGGQRQRVAIGRAMVREPVVYLMDEPLSNLDAKLRVSMRAELARLHDRLGVTTVYVTHDQIEAMTLGDRVCVMLDGTIQQVDTPTRLFHSPVNTFVAAAIGSPAMNLAVADVDGDTVRFGEYRVALTPGHRAAVGPRQQVVVRPAADGLQAAAVRLRAGRRDAARDDGPACGHGRDRRATRRRADPRLPGGRAALSPARIGLGAAADDRPGRRGDAPRGARQEQVHGPSRHAPAGAPRRDPGSLVRRRATSTCLIPKRGSPS